VGTGASQPVSSRHGGTGSGTVHAAQISRGCGPGAAEYQCPPCRALRYRSLVSKVVDVAFYDPKTATKLIPAVGTHTDARTHARTRAQAHTRTHTRACTHARAHTHDTARAEPPQGMLAPLLIEQPLAQAAPDTLAKVASNGSRFVLGYGRTHSGTHTVLTGTRTSIQQLALRARVLPTVLRRATRTNSTAAARGSPASCVAAGRTVSTVSTPPYVRCRCVTYDAINGVWAEYDAKARVSWCGPAGLCRSRLARMVAGTGALLSGAMTRAGYRTSSGRSGRTHRGTYRVLLGTRTRAGGSFRCINRDRSFLRPFVIIDLLRELIVAML
jgi:hypothetical protein